MMYQEMVVTKELLSGVQLEMNSIYKSLEDIRRNSYISAQCSKIAARNSKALKYIALING